MSVCVCVVSLVSVDKFGLSDRYLLDTRIRTLFLPIVIVHGDEVGLVVHLGQSGGITACLISHAYFFGFLKRRLWTLFEYRGVNMRLISYVLFSLVCEEWRRHRLHHLRLGRLLATVMELDFLQGQEVLEFGGRVVRRIYVAGRLMLDSVDYVRLLLTDYIEEVPLSAGELIRESVYLVGVVGRTVLRHNGFLDDPRADFMRGGWCALFPYRKELLYVSLSLTPFAGVTTNGITVQRWVIRLALPF
jgi:hypothetical protein